MRTKWILAAALTVFACKSSRVQNEPGTTGMTQANPEESTDMAAQQRDPLPSSNDQAKNDASSPLESHIRDLWTQLDGVRDRLASDPTLQSRYGGQATQIAKELAEVQRTATEDPTVSSDASKQESVKNAISRIEMDINNLEDQVGA